MAAVCVKSVAELIIDAVKWVNDGCRFNLVTAKFVKNSVKLFLLTQSVLGDLHS